MPKILICRFVGHKESAFTDSGYGICERCGSHAYYNSDQWLLAWLWPPKRWWIQLRWWWEEYQFQRELKRIESGSEDDFPF